MVTSETLVAQILDEDQAKHAGMARQTAPKAQGKSYQSGATRGVCRNSGKKGHNIEDCWAKDGGKEGQAPVWYKEPKDSTKQADGTDFAFMTNDITLATIMSSDWIANSGSSTHIARNRLDFTSYVKESSEIDGVAPGATFQT